MIGPFHCQRAWEHVKNRSAALARERDRVSVAAGFERLGYDAGGMQLVVADMLARLHDVRHYFGHEAAVVHAFQAGIEFERHARELERAAHRVVGRSE